MSYWQNKVAIVTGASRGLGRVLAETFAARGAKVVLAARGGDALEAAAEPLRRRGYDVLAVSTDVTRDEDVARLVAETLDRFGRIDVLVNNAGRSTRGEILAATPEEFDELWRLNFLGAVRCARAVAEHLIAADGHLVNIGSLASKIAGRHLGPYPASKFALAAYSQQLRLELGPRGLHVLLVCPGPIERDDSGSRYDEAAQGLPESAKKPGGGVKLPKISPERLADEILRGCERRKLELVLPRRARWLVVLSQLWPALGDWIVRRKT